MKWYRILAVLHRYWIVCFRDFNQATNLLLWPSLQMILWGFNGAWVAKTTSSGIPFVSILVSVSVLWITLARANSDFIYGLVQEIWAHNVINLFVSPLTVGEWMLGLVLSTLIKNCLLFGVCFSLAYFLYGVNIITIGPIIIGCWISLALSGLTLGILSAALLIYYGKQVESLMWLSYWILAPLCGIYYSITVLPAWAQAISRHIPMAFVFENVRKVLENQPVVFTDFLYNFIFIIAYLGASIIFFKYMFEKSRQKGLGRL